jgi:hypothetical protein
LAEGFKMLMEEDDEVSSQHHIRRCLADD